MNELTWLIAAGLAAAISGADSTSVLLPPDGAWVEFSGSVSIAPDSKLSVSPAEGAPLLGRVERRPGGLVFHPVLPFLTGQRYRASWRELSGAWRHVDFSRPQPKRERPTVQLRPTGPLPANALKVYLHFSRPMEQGVWLERLRLLDAKGREIPGPFRETELWSPDGKRLTVWFHPGRQKTGVNLNVEEGPVLREGQRHTLVVSKQWRDTSGIPLGHDVLLRFSVGPADSQPPSIKNWTLTPPRAGSHGRLVVHFPEPLDPAMLQNALSVIRASGEALALTVQATPDGRSWNATPAEPWLAGPYTLVANPLLEDLAGNSLARPFEVDLASNTAAAPIPRGFALPWSIAP